MPSAVAKTEGTLAVPKIVSALLLAVLGAIGCNDHPLQVLEGIVTATNRQENRMPAKTKIDFLMLVDDSNSMCQEQANLTANFSAFSQFLFEELGRAADYRIAVVSTDMSKTNADRGKFLAKPAIEPMGFRSCRDENNENYVPDTADCQGLLDQGQLRPILRSDQVQSKADLERKFRCMATLGVKGDGYEKGLEAMRYSLSCSGPNSDYFSECCVDDAKDPAGRRRVFNPACETDPEMGLEPEFLRPDALLVVIFVSDENDCSDPAANPNESRRAICRYDYSQDQNGDMVPDGYNDQVLCEGKTPQQCFRDECGTLTPAECYSRRCEVAATSNYRCEWDRDNLTPVADYFTFLTGLKPRPAEQLVVATIVGQRDYTPMGFEILFNEGAVASDEGGVCLPMRELSMGTEYVVNRDVVRSDMCCPQGSCSGDVISSCVSTNGSADSGRRYLDLADLFGENGIGCPKVTVDDVTPDMLSACEGQQVDDPCSCRGGIEMDCDGKCRPVQGDGRLACSDCLSICEDSFAAPLLAIKEKVAEVLAAYCLDKMPACYVATQEGARVCETPAEFAASANYPIRVRRQCLQSEGREGFCEEPEMPRILSPEEWYLELGQDACPGGARLRLRDPPPAGAEIFVEFFVAFDEEAIQGAGGATVADEGAAPSSPSGAQPASGPSAGGQAATASSDPLGTDAPAGEPPMGGAAVELPSETLGGSSASAAGGAQP